MKAPRTELIRTAFRPASALWALVSGTRNALYDRRWAHTIRLPVPVVSIGNITVGGTGKTPLVIHLAQILQSAGIRPLVLSRGYRSRGSGTRFVSDEHRILVGLDEAGDEPLLIAQRVHGVPVVVDPDRARGGREGIKRFSPGIVLLDDGFQHRRLERDLDVVVLDAIDPFGRYALLPSGLLREPFKGLGRADVFVVTHAPDGEGLETLTAVVRRYNSRAAILRARHHAEALVPVAADFRRSAVGEPGSAGLPEPAPERGTIYDPSRLQGTAVYAFCGIGNPRGFHSTLEEAGAKLAGFEAFPDHHPYGRDEIERVASAARRAGASFIVTTEKDAVRIAGVPVDPPFFALRIRMRLTPEEPLTERLLGLARPGGAGSEEALSRKTAGIAQHE